MKKMIKVPTSLTSGLVSQSALKLDGCSVIEQCIHSMEGSGTMFLEEHLLLFVLEGSNTLAYGKQVYVVNKNEMILLKKATAIKYEKKGNPDNDNIYDSLMFCLMDDILKDFLTKAEVSISRSDEEIKTTVNPMSDYLVAFAHSLKPYFNNPSEVNPGLLRLKIMELLFDVSKGSQNTFRQILQFREPVRASIKSVVEQNYISPVSIPELAYLSGRSVSSFKRDFVKTFNDSPSRWIRAKRLEKAKEMLEISTLSISEICFSVGFENISHFSRIFKEQYGISPNSYRK